MKNLFIIVAVLLKLSAGTYAADALPIADQIRAQIQAILAKDGGTDATKLKALVGQELNNAGIPASDQLIAEEITKYIATKLHVGVPVIPVGKGASGTISRPLDVFGPVDFGAGIGLMSDFGSDKRVKNATVDSNGIIRIEEEDDLTPQPMLEAHIAYRWHPKLNEIELGPYIGILPGGENIIKGIGGGLMIGFRRIEPKLATMDDPTTFRAEPGAIRIGVGVMVEPNVQVLGEGLEENERLPAGETLRYREKNVVGLQILISFGI